MKKIAITGLSGVLGSTIFSQLVDKYEIIHLFHTQPFAKSAKIQHVKLDLFDKYSIQPTLAQVKPDVILHLAAITHIDTCEQDKKHGKEGKVWKVNVGATQEIASYASKNPCHLIFMSTESIFDGKKTEYMEDDKANPMSWYGHSKAAAEESIRKSGAHSSILRAVIAYSLVAEATTIYSQLLAQLKEKKPFKVVSDQYITPTFIPDIGRAVNAVIQLPKEGIFHITPDQKSTPYQFALTLAEKLGYDKELIKPVSLEEFLGSERAKLRVKNACLSSKYTQSELGFTLHSLQDVLEHL